MGREEDITGGFAVIRELRMRDEECLGSFVRTSNAKSDSIKRSSVETSTSMDGYAESLAPRGVAKVPVPGSIFTCRGVR